MHNNPLYKYNQHISIISYIQQYHRHFLLTRADSTEIPGAEQGRLREIQQDCRAHHQAHRKAQGVRVFTVSYESHVEKSCKVTSFLPSSRAGVLTLRAFEIRAPWDGPCKACLPLSYLYPTSKQQYEPLHVTGGVHRQLSKPISFRITAATTIPHSSAGTQNEDAISNRRPAHHRRCATPGCFYAATRCGC